MREGRNLFHFGRGNVSADNSPLATAIIPGQ